MREKIIDKLARDLEKPRAVRLLAEWLAIEHDKTRLQGDEYMGAAQELYDYLLIVGFRLLPLICSGIEKGLLSDIEIGDSLDLEKEYTFPRSDGSLIMAIDCRPAVRLQLQKILALLKGKEGANE